MRMSKFDSSEFQTWDNDPQASVLDRAENMSLLIISNKVDSRTLAEMPKVQMNLNHTFVIRGRVNVC